MLVGLGITLATASVIEQKAMIRIAQQQQRAPLAAPDSTPPVQSVKIKTNEPAHSLLASAWRHRHEVE